MIEALLAALVADAGLRAVVGDRIAWSALPQGASLPAIALHLISSPRQYTYKGVVPNAGHLVQASCWGANRKDARRAQLALEAAVETLKTEPLQVFLIAARDLGADQADGPSAAGVETIRGIAVDLRVWA